MNSDPWCSNHVACILPTLESSENIRQTKIEEHSVDIKVKKTREQFQEHDN